MRMMRVRIRLWRARPMFWSSWENTPRPMRSMLRLPRRSSIFRRQIRWTCGALGPANVLNQQAIAFETRPIQIQLPAEQRENLAAAEKLLTQEIAILEK